MPPLERRLPCILLADRHTDDSYDYDNRLTQVSYEGGGSAQVAHFEYDALGRMISAQLRFDSDVDGDSATSKYYYDGQNVLAEYDGSDNLVRRHVHGTTYVDERAVLLEGEGENLDTYYYLLQDLYSVTGLIQKNGALVEANTYDTYGRVSPWSYHPCDVWLLDGTVNAADNGYFRTKLNGSGNPTVDPSTDFDMDGDTDDDDQTTMLAAIGQPSGVEIYTSGVGNPYFFTGRRLHFLETLHDGSPTDTETNGQVQYNRRRHYDPRHGRWLQRDPAGYTDGMNLYEYVSSRPALFRDPFGLWRIRRDGRERALALSDAGDTVHGLAQLIRLNSAEYRNWLWDVDLSEECCRYPDSAHKRLEGDCEFSIPNTITFVWGQLPGFDSWYHPVSIYGKIASHLRQEREAFRSFGFSITELDSPTADVVTTALRSPHLYIFFYGGHGGGDGSLVPRPPADANPRVLERVYRRGDLYKLAGMSLMACYSADLSSIEAARNAPNLNTWRDNVSDRGGFVGLMGEASYWENQPYLDAAP